MTAIYSESDKSRINLAFALAAVAHEGQTRKNSGEPYITHPTRVYRTLAETGLEADIAIAGILHDTVEDSNGHVTLETIEASFGKRVRDIIDALTHRKGEDYFADYLSRVLLDPAARRVKRADVLDNMRDLDPKHRNWAKYVKVLTLIGETEALFNKL